MWPGMGEDGLGDEDAMPALPRWLNVNLPRMNGAMGPMAGANIGRIGGAMGIAGEAAIGGRGAVEVHQSTPRSTPAPA